MSKIIGTYIIIYPDNGCVSQKKNLIRHEDYVNVIKPLFAKILSLTSEQLKYGKKNKRYSEIEKEITEIKRNIKNDFGDEYFTDSSPLFQSIYNDGFMLLPKWQGGKIRVELKKIC